MKKVLFPLVVALSLFAVEAAQAGCRIGGKLFHRWRSAPTCVSYSQTNWAPAHTGGCSGGSCRP